MVEILAMATVIAPVTSGVVQALKNAININKRYLPAAATLIGMIIGAAAYFLDAEPGWRVWAGGISGLAATGLFELSKQTAKGEGKND